MEQNFELNGATSAVKSVNSVYAKIYCDTIVSNISVLPITSKLLQPKFKNNMQTSLHFGSSLENIRS